MVVALEEMVKRDETLIDLADMPYGHLATRVRGWRRKSLDPAENEGNVTHA